MITVDCRKMFEDDIFIIICTLKAVFYMFGCRLGESELETKPGY